MKKIVYILLISLCTLQAQDESIKIVYNLTTDNLEKFELHMFKSIVANKAHYEGEFRNLDVSVVIHGGAYKFFVKNPAQTKFKEDKALIQIHKELGKRIESMAKNYDVEFLMCQVGMNKRDLKKKDIYDFVTIVPNATIGLTDKQNEGYAYIPVAN